MECVCVCVCVCVCARALLCALWEGKTREGYERQGNEGEKEVCIKLQRNKKH